MRPGVSAALLVALLLVMCGSVVRADETQEPKFGLRPATFDGPSSTGYFILDSQPGATVTNAVWVVNTGTAAGVARLYAVDASTGNTSGTIYGNEADPRQDVGSWASLDTDEVTLKPGEGRAIPFSLTVPKSVRPGTHLGGVVVANKAQEDANAVASSGFQVKFSTLSIVAIQVNLPGPSVDKVTVSGVQPSGTPGDQTIIFGLRNDGTTMLKPIGRLQITNDAGVTVQNLPLTLDTFVPQTAIEYPVHIQNTALDVGNYEASLMLTYGETRQETRYTGHFAITSPQLAQVFQPAVATTAPPATLAPPKSIANAAAQPANGALTSAASTSAPHSWGMIAALGGGATLFVALPLTGFLLGRRRKA